MIYFDYTRAIRQASEIESCADKLHAIGQSDVPAIQSPLRRAWSGEAEVLFHNNTDGLIAELMAEADQLRSVALRIRQVADTIRRSEEAARQAAANKSE